MKLPACALTFAAVLLALPDLTYARGGGHGGGGHGSGGHGSSGRAASNSGHAASSGRAQSPGKAGSAHASTSQVPTHGHPRSGQPIVGTAIPRPATPATSPPPIAGATVILPSYPLFGFNGNVGFYAASSALFGYAGPIDSGAVNSPTGGLRLQIEPADAEVFLDGDYAGMVADFNGTFHHLNLAPGPHHVNVRALGYEPIAFDVIIQAHHTTRYRAALTTLPLAR
jgi:hypothetical protein